MAASDSLSAEGIAAAVIELRHAQPYDENTVLGSVADRRCVIVHEACTAPAGWAPRCRPYRGRACPRCLHP